MKNYTTCNYKVRVLSLPKKPFGTAIKWNYINGNSLSGMEYVVRLSNGQIIKEVQDFEVEIIK